MSALLLPQSNTLFLHVPKTGGTWVCRALSDALIDTRLMNAEGYSLCHPPRRAFEHDGPVISCVRHPLSWLGSWFAYFRRREWKLAELDNPGMWHPMREVKGTAADEFPEFVGKWIQRHPGFITRMFGWYEGTHVVRQESLQHDLQKVLQQLGHKEVLTYAGRPKRSNWEPRISDWQLKMITASECEIVNRWYR